MSRITFIQLGNASRATMIASPLPLMQHLQLSAIARFKIHSHPFVPAGITMSEESAPPFLVKDAGEL